MNRNITIAWTGTPSPLYAQVTEGQYEILLDRDNHPGAVMSVYAQLTPNGEVSPRVIRLNQVTGIDLWEPPTDSGIAREWPDSL